MHFDEAFRHCFVKNYMFYVPNYSWLVFFSVEPVQKRAIFEIICIFL